MSSVDFKGLYAKLGTLTVSIPETAPGEPVDLHGLAGLFIQVQRNRDTGDELLRAVLSRLGNAKRRLDTKKQELRIERALVGDDGALIDPRAGETVKRARLDQLTANTSGQVSELSGRVADLESAKEAVEATLRSLDRAKETLNALKSIAMATVSPSNNPMRYTPRSHH